MTVSRPNEPDDIYTVDVSSGGSSAGPPASPGIRGAFWCPIAFGSPASTASPCPPTTTARSTTAPSATTRSAMSGRSWTGSNPAPSSTPPAWGSMARRTAATWSWLDGQYGDRLAAGCDVVGLSNLITFLEGTSAYRRHARRAESGDERDPVARAALHALSPLANADRIQSPPSSPTASTTHACPSVRPNKSYERSASAASRPGTWVAPDEGHGFRSAAPATSSTSSWAPSSSAISWSPTRHHIPLRRTPVPPTPHDRPPSRQGPASNQSG